METPPPRSSSSGAADSVFQQQRMSSGADADEDKAPVAASPASAGFLLHVAQKINRGFQKSLTKVVSDIGQEYGLASTSLAQVETGDLASAFDAGGDDESPSDVRLIIQELQSSRQKERALRLRVDALENEQKLATERLALYSVLALKLKRELVNERLAHIDSKKDAAELRAKLQNQNQNQQDSGDESSAAGAAAAAAAGRSSQDANLADEDDPWSSPVKAPGSNATAGSKLLSFTSFYHSARAADGSNEDEPPSPMSSASGSLQPLRSSLMDQFLPSSLLDSPQITPSSSSGTDRKDSEQQQQDRRTFEAEINEGLEAFSLSEPPCNQCKQQPVSECAPCGHRLCASCEASMLTRHDQTCPRCRAKVSSVKELSKKGPREEDNQVEHFLEGDRLGKRQSGTISSPLSANVAATTTTTTTAAAVAVSPITLSLLAELFDSIPVEQLEVALKESAGQASQAIEKILDTHPSFNPGQSASSSASASPMAPGHKAALHRSTSTTNPLDRTGGSGGSGGGNAGGASGGGGGSSSASSNWKTEMCMYYLQGKCNKTRRTCSFAHGESDLVRSGTAGKHAQGVGFKTRMCPLYLEGLCPKSRRDCPLAHGESDLRDGLAVLASSAVLPAAAPRLQSYKTELCYYYLKGCCNYTKEECRFAHGESDLRTVESNTMEWSAKLGGGGIGVGDYSPGPGSVSSVSSAQSAPLGMSVDKQLQHQHQYQQQFQPQFPPPQQPPQQPPSQQQQQQQQLQHGSPAFPPPPVHQLGLPHQHQFSYHQHMPPPHMPLHHQQAPSQSMYHGSPSVAQAHQFRYLKSMEDAAKRGARPPPQPRRDTSSWSGAYESSAGGDF